MFIWIGIVASIIIIAVIVFLIVAKVTKGANRKYQDRLEQTGFNADISFTPGIFCIFVDETNGMWSLKHSNKTEPSVYRFSDLSGFDMYEYGILSGSVYSGMDDIGLLKFGYVNQGHKKSKDVRLEVKFKNNAYPPVSLKFINVY